MSRFEHGAREDVYRFESRKEAADKMNVSEGRLEALLRKFPTWIDGDIIITSYMHGGTNQSFALRPVGKSGVQPPIVAKFYNNNPSSSAGGAVFSLHREKNFLQCLERNGVACVPRVIGCDLGSKIGLYTYSEGIHKQPDEVTEGDVLQMVDFMSIVNRSELLPTTSMDIAATKPRCAIRDHEVGAKGRLQIATTGVEAIIEEGDDMGLAIEATAILSSIQQVCDALMEVAKLGWFSNVRVLSNQELLPCSMDVGLHNTLFTPAGKANFVDFEEVGWQDPVYQFANFYMHPRFQELAEPIKWAALGTIVDRLSGEGDALERLPAALAFSNVEWSARMLESLSPQRREARIRASPGLDWEAFKEGTLSSIDPLAWVECAKIVPGVDGLRASVVNELQKPKAPRGTGGRLLDFGMPRD